ncbi:hypothetical protein OS127_02790 [Corynebacterium sp. P6129]|uniref:hypothetical protein n=1 Tax=Corynebacterium antarcticum TaxID=2800405 RepID=UPI002260C2D0|nr:hypothetical protein [Corynebacterium antarcticum]MCX7491456.1 hypothetical protein [Corynebacterium antarcticum]
MYAIYSTRPSRSYPGPSFARDLDTLAYELIENARDRDDRLVEHGGDLEALARMVYPLDESELDDGETNPVAPTITAGLLERAASILWDVPESKVIIDDEHPDEVHSTIDDAEAAILPFFADEVDLYDTAEIARAAYTYVPRLDGFVPSTFSEDEFWGICTQNTVTAPVEEPDWYSGDEPPADAEDPVVDQAPAGTYVMEGAELQARIDGLGINAAKLSQVLQVHDRTVRRWLAGTTPISTKFSATINQITDVTDRWVDQVAASSEVTIHHDGWRILDDGVALPEAWWRAVVGRAAARNPELLVSWGD